MSRALQQLGLFAPGARNLEAETWNVGAVDRSGLAAYLHLIRTAEDPERMSRKEAHALGIWEVTSKRRLNSITVEEWRRMIEAWFRFRRESERPVLAATFNQLMVELADQTADVAFESNADVALWALVADGVLEHTLRAPILFRLKPAPSA